MADEKILIEIEVDNEQALKDLDKQNQEIEELEQNLKTLKDQQGKNSKEYQTQQQKLKQVRQERNANLKLIKAETNSLGQIKGALAAANKARDKVNLSTKQGRQEYKLLTKQIKQYNTTLKKAEQQGGSFARNVGNYSDALGQMNPAIGGVISSIRGMTTAALAFIATPFGAVLAAIVAAIGAVITYFKRTVDGGDKLAKIMGTVSGSFEAFLDIVTALGKIIVDSLITNARILGDRWTIMSEKVSQGIIKIQIAFNKLRGKQEEVNKLSKELQESTDKEAAARESLKKNIEDNNKRYEENTKNLKENIDNTGKKIEKSVELATAERNLQKYIKNTTKANAEYNRQIFEGLKIAKDESLSFEERRKGLEQAAKAELAQAAIKEEIAAKELEIARQAEANNASNLEDKKALEDAEAKLIEAQTNSLRVQTKIQATRITLDKQQEAADNKEAARVQRLADQKAEFARQEEQARVDAIESDKERYEEQIKLEESEYARKQEAITREYEDEEERLFQLAKLKFEYTETIKGYDEDYASAALATNAEIKADNKKKADDEKALKKQVADYNANLLNAGLNLAKTIAGENEDLVKAIGYVQVAVNTAQGIMRAFADLPYPAAVPAALAVAATGAAQAIAISRADSSGSVNSVPVSAGTMPNTSAADQNVQQTQALEDAIASIGVSVSVSEINDVQNNVQVTEAQASI